MIMGDKGGRKDKIKNEKQNRDKSAHKKKARVPKQQKDGALLIFPKTV